MKEAARLKLTAAQMAILHGIQEEANKLAIARQVRLEALEVAARTLFAGTTEDEFAQFMLNGDELVAMKKEEGD